MQVVYEDNHIIIVSKKAGEIVQGDITGDRTLCEDVKAYIKDRYAKPGAVFLGVVHRLDRPAMGLVIFARTSKALSRLNEMLRVKDKIRKTYWAIVAKRPPRDEDHLEQYLVRNAKNNKTYVAREGVKDAKLAALDYRVVCDTGSDCIGTAHRQGCKSVTQIEIMPKPVEGPEDPKNPWPNWPRTLKTTSSHEEGCTRRWNINSLEFLGKNGKLTGVKVQPIDWKPNPEGGRPLMVEAGEPEIIKAEAVFLAMGFLKPQQPEFAENVFVAGDAASGASLVVRAMASGRKIAAQVDKFLTR